MKRFRYILFIFVTGAMFGDTVIFDKAKPINVLYAKCDRNTSIQIVEQENEFGRIVWQWDNKKDSWCGWGTDSIPKDLTTEYEKILMIRYIGNFSGKPPEVKFIDIYNKSSSLVSFENYSLGNQVTGAIAQIPIKKFFQIGKKDTFDQNNVKALQFNAEYSSSFGKISITGIAIIDKPLKDPP